MNSIDLATFLPWRLHRVAEWVNDALAADCVVRHGTTRAEWCVLAALGQCGSMTATAIGALSSMHKTKVSRAVKSLEERRWIRRDVDASDRRLEHLELTTLGKSVVDEMVGAALAFETRLAGSVGAGTVAAGDRLLAALEALMPPDAGAAQPPRERR